MTAYPIGVVGRVAKSTPTAFWTNHLSAFKNNGIPTEIDTQELQYNTKKHSPWVKASYSDIARGNLPATMTDTKIANTSAQGQENNSMEYGTGDGSNLPATQTDSPRDITGLSNLKIKMAAIDLERGAFKVDQASIKEEVSTMTSSLEKMADDIISVRQDMTNMSARFRSDISDLKQLILNMSATKRGHTQSKSSAGSSTSSAEKELINLWTHMKILLTIWQLHGPTSANLKTTLHIKIMFHKAIVHPARARLGRTDVCLRHHG
jgi:hypothetical protein